MGLMLNLTQKQEYYFNLIKKGPISTNQLITKSGKTRSYVSVYTRDLEDKGLIEKSICKHCDTSIVLTTK